MILTSIDWIIEREKKDEIIELHHFILVNTFSFLSSIWEYEMKSIFYYYLIKKSEHQPFILF